jgi:hypothetical protein
MRNLTLLRLTDVSRAFSQVFAAMSGTVTDSSGRHSRRRGRDREEFRAGATRETVTDDAGHYRLL